MTFDETDEFDRCQWGRRWSAVELAQEFAENGCMDWNAITGVACILAESGGWELIRPVVVNPPDMRFHLSVDRGLAQFNSVAWGPFLLADGITPNPKYIPDREAFDGKRAIFHMIDIASPASGWKFDYATHWHAAKPDPVSGARPLDVHLPVTRDAVNVVRAEYGVEPI